MRDPSSVPEMCTQQPDRKNPHRSYELPMVDGEEPLPAQTHSPLLYMKSLWAEHEPSTECSAGSQSSDNELLPEPWGGEEKRKRKQGSGCWGERRLCELSSLWRRQKVACRERVLKGRCEVCCRS